MERVRALRKRIAGDLGPRRPAGAHPRQRRRCRPSTYVDQAARRRGGPRRGARPGTSWCSATTRGTCPGTPPPTRSSGCPPCGCRASSPSCSPPRAPPSSTARRSSSPTSSEVVRRTRPTCSPARTCRCSSTRSKTVAPVVAERDRHATRSRWPRCSGCCATLLAEGVPVRDLTRILEAVTARRARQPRPRGARRGRPLGRSARPSPPAPRSAAGCRPSPSSRCSSSRCSRPAAPARRGTWLALDPMRMEALVAGVGEAVRTAENAGHRPAVVCSAQLRPAIRRLLVGGRPDLPVLSFTELSRNVSIEPVGVIHLAEPHRSLTRSSRSSPATPSRRRWRTPSPSLGPDLTVRRARRVRKGVQGLRGKERYEVVAVPAARAGDRGRRRQRLCRPARAGRAARRTPIPVRRTARPAHADAPPVVLGPCRSPVRGGGVRPGRAAAAPVVPEIDRRRRRPPRRAPVRARGRRPPRPAPAPRRGPPRPAPRRTAETSGWGRTALRRARPAHGRPRGAAGQGAQERHGLGRGADQGVRQRAAGARPVGSGVRQRQGLEGVKGILAAARKGMTPGTITYAGRTAPPPPPSSRSPCARRCCDELREAPGAGPGRPARTRARRRQALDRRPVRRARPACAWASSPALSCSPSGCCCPSPGASSPPASAKS